MVSSCSSFAYLNGQNLATCKESKCLEKKTILKTLLFLNYFKPEKYGEKRT